MALLNATIIAVLIMIGAGALALSTWTLLGIAGVLFSLQAIARLKRRL